MLTKSAFSATLQSKHFKGIEPGGDGQRDHYSINLSE